MKSLEPLSFAHLVKFMREAQKKYFKTKYLEDLDTAKSLERQVDHELAIYETEASGLPFGTAKKDDSP